MRKVCIQVGHQNIENITSEGLRSWRSASTLKSSTGASGERDWHWDQWMPKLRDKLIQAGIQVYVVDAIYHQDTYSQEYDLWISGHYDGGGIGERCMVSAPNRDTLPAYLNSGAQGEAERFAAIWKGTYPNIVGVPNRDDMVTAGMKDYYAFDYVGYDTPSVIIEHFNHTSPMGTELKNNSDLVVEGDYQSILKFLGETNEDTSCEDKVKDLETQVKVQAGQILEQGVIIGELESELDKTEKLLFEETRLKNEARQERDAFKGELQVATGKIETLSKRVTTLEEENKGLKDELLGSVSGQIKRLSLWELVKIKFFGGGEKE